MDLRAYQAQLFHRLLAMRDEHGLAEYPTGSGKTSVVAAAATAFVTEPARDNGYRRAVVATTQDILVNAFATAFDAAGQQQFVWPPSNGERGPGPYPRRPGGGFTVNEMQDIRVINVQDPERDRQDGDPPFFISATSTTQTRVADVVREYLERPPTFRNGRRSARQRQQVLVCTHAALTRIWPPSQELTRNGRPYDLRYTWLFVDEAHHAGALGLSQFVNAWVRCGGRVLYFTATGYRSDGIPVVLRNMREYRDWTLARHMEAGFAPGRIRMGITPVKVAGTVRPQQQAGEAPPPRRVWRALVAEMVARWEREGKPKIIIRLPVMRGGSAELLAMTDRAFRRTQNLFGEPTRVVDVTGQQARHKRYVRQIQSTERAAGRFADSQIDVMLGIQRVLEGFDWRWCSHLYYIGFPQAATTRTQGLGRTTRDKSDDDMFAGMPADHRNHATMHMFVPCAERHATPMLEDHARQVLAVITHIEYGTASIPWGQRLKSHGMTPLASRPGETTDTRVSQTDPGGVELIVPVVEHSRVRLEAQLGREPTVEEIYQDIVNAGLADRDEDPVDIPLLVNFLVRQQLQAEAGEDADPETIRVTQAATNQFMRRINAALGGDRRSTREALREVLADFSLAFPGLEGHRGIVSRVFELTGQDIRRWAERLLVNRPITEAWVLAEAARFRQRTRRWPVRTDGGVIPGWLESWRDIDTIIRHGRRGWPRQLRGGLAEFLRESRAARSA